MKRNSYAKINLSLDVLNKSKPKDYHELDMINLLVDLHDVVKIKIYPNRKDIVIKTNNDKVPTDSKNIVYKVITRFKEVTKKEFGIEVELIKNIPTEAGLGGGSSNAATVLSMLDKYFHIGMSNKQKVSFIASLTADGPFFIANKTARVKGIGDKINLIDSKLKAKVMIVKPYQGCSTKEIYGSLDYPNLVHPNNNKIETALLENNLDEIKKHACNSLQASAIRINNQISDVLTRLKVCGFDVVLMSGSGSSCFGISNKKAPFERALQIFNKDNYELVGIYKIRK